MGTCYWRTANTEYNRYSIESFCVYVSITSLPVGAKIFISDLMQLACWEHKNMKVRNSLHRKKYASDQFLQ